VSRKLIRFDTLEVLRFTFASNALYMHLAKKCWKRRCMNAVENSLPRGA